MFLKVSNSFLWPGTCAFTSKCDNE
uniref:Uncharacterized protein n=1 Tax=Anguilla anguilla TaxID=7936 RepID=A0A0E9SHH8_ANGAN